MIADTLQQLWSSAREGDPSSLLALVCFGGIYLCITVALEIALWRRCAAFNKKLFWSVILTIPVLGWLFYLAFFQVPPSRAPR